MHDRLSGCSTGVGSRLHRAPRLACKAQRGVVILPGLGNNKQDYEPLGKALRDRGLAVSVASVRRVDWLRNAAGLLDGAYWRGALKPLPVLNWYVERVSEAAEEVGESSGGGPVTLLAHSAGGWLARVYLLAKGTQTVDRLVTLGSPHQPPPTGVSGVIDQTRGILNHIAETCPGRFHDNIQYVTVAGKYLQGAEFGDKEAGWKRRIVGAGYKQVCGDAEAWGDGVVPVPSAHLEGALQLTLDGVYHSPVGSAVDSDAGRRWYGSKGVLEEWIEHVGADAADLQEASVELGDLADASVPQQ